MLTGRKTYIVAAMVLGLGAGRYFEWIDPTQAEAAFWTLMGLGFMTLRAGLKTEAKVAAKEAQK